MFIPMWFEDFQIILVEGGGNGARHRFHPSIMLSQLIWDEINKQTDKENQERFESDRREQEVRDRFSDEHDDGDYDNDDDSDDEEEEDD